VTQRDSYGRTTGTQEGGRILPRDAVGKPAALPDARGAGPNQK